MVQVIIVIYLSGIENYKVGIIYLLWVVGVRIIFEIFLGIRFTDETIVEVSVYLFLIRV